MKSKTKASCYRMFAVYYPSQRLKFAHLYSEFCWNS